MKPLILCAGLVSTIGCPTQEVPSASSKATAVMIADEAIPVQTDFEDEARKAVTADNYAEVLTTIEAEIEADKPK